MTPPTTPGTPGSTRILTSDLADHAGQVVDLAGWVLTRRDLGGLGFLILRDRSGVVQCVVEKAVLEAGGLGGLPLQESYVELSGKVSSHQKAPGGVEVHVTRMSVANAATEPPPVELSKEEWHANPDTLLAYRHVTVRTPRTRAALKVKAVLVKGFRAFLDTQGFTEVFTPKLVSAGAEGGANLFEVDFYGQRAYLAQSPQLYKQIMVGVFERVYETAPVYRAEKSHTTRHLSEYLSLDVEFGPITDEEDVMALQEATVKHMLATVESEAASELEAFGETFPDLSVSIPRVPLLEARKIVEERYGHASGGKDLDPEAERLIGRWAKEQHGSDFVFVTKFPEAARPFYTYPEGNGLTRGLDLIFRGVEITSGGQRAHRHDVLVDELRKRGMDTQAFADYLEVFKHGMPPHGGFAIGAERLTALLLGIQNVRFTRAFPRDSQRLRP